jgi:hypothetical protein
MQQQASVKPSQPREVAEILRRLSPAASAAQLRTFACLCARRVWPLIDERLHHLVELAERLARGEISKKEARQGRSFAVRVRRELQDGPASRWHAAGAVMRALDRVPAGWDDASAAVREAAREGGASREEASAAWASERFAQGTLLLSVVGPQAAA